ncbi:MAG: PrgI family protein [Patescibacteria group bacterium]
MNQHPVPQNISSYEFHLVGDMTLKQFFQLAGGVAVAVVIYRLPLPLILKWPMMGLAALTGVMLAFVPVSGRPFSQWIMAFIKAIYSPTEFHWSETPPPPATMNHEPTNPPTKKTPLDIIESQLFARFSQIFSHPNLAFSAIQPNPQPSTLNPQSPILRSQPPVSPLPKPTATMNHELITSNPVPPPEHPNLLTGLVLDPAGSYLEGVILELSDAAGLPVRALRSNKLGQFMTATPLPTGTYTLIAEKEGLHFASLTLSVKNQIIDPILIKAQA